MFQKKKRVPVQNFLPPNLINGIESKRGTKDQWMKDLGMEPNKFTIFLGTGSEGANNHLSLLKTLLPISNSIQVIVVCGKNQILFHRISRWVKNNQSLTVHLDGFSTCVHEYMRLSDAVVTRGGSNISTEALFFQCPILFNCIGGTMPQERLTIQYFLNHGAGAAFRSVHDFNKIISDWMTYSEDYKNFQMNLRRIRLKDNPKKLISQIIEFASTSIRCDSQIRTEIPV